MKKSVTLKTLGRLSRQCDTHHMWKHYQRAGGTVMRPFERRSVHKHHRMLLISCANSPAQLPSHRWSGVRSMKRLTDASSRRKSEYTLPSLLIESTAA